MIAQSGDAQLREENRRLVERIEELEFELDEARERPGEAHRDLTAWGLSLRESGRRMMFALSEAAPNVVSSAILFDLIESRATDEYRVLKVQICLLRKKLKRINLSVHTAWGIGYFMTVEDAERWHRWVALCAAGEGPASDFTLSEA